MFTLLVKDYDEAAKWYSENLGCAVRDNKDMRPGKRWVAMYSTDSPSPQIVLHQPGNGYMSVDKELSADRIGKETFWILHTTDFDAEVKRLHDGGVHFRSETYPLDSGGKEIVFEDLYGNLWVLQQGFFTEVARRASALNGDERANLEARIQTARELAGGQGAVDRFLKWKLPSSSASGDKTLSPLKPKIPTTKTTEIPAGRIERPRTRRPLVEDQRFQPNRNTSLRSILEGRESDGCATGGLGRRVCRIPVSDSGTFGGLSQSVSQFGFAGSSTSL